MESSLVTIILVLLLVFMMFNCGKSMRRKAGGCCGSSDSDEPNFNELASKLDHLEKENESLKKKINEMK